MNYQAPVTAGTQPLMKDSLTPKAIVAALDEHIVGQTGRDLVEEAVRLERERRRDKVREASESAAMDRLLDALTGKGASEATRASFSQRFGDGSLDGAEVEIEVAEAPNMPFEIPGGGGVAFNLTEMMSKAMGGPPKKRRKLKVRD